MKNPGLVLQIAALLFWVVCTQQAQAQQPEQVNWPATDVAGPKLKGQPARNPADTLFDWSAIDLAGPRFKGKKIKSIPLWPFIAGGVAGVITIVVITQTDGDEPTPPTPKAVDDAITVTGNGGGSVNVLANDTGEGISLTGFSSPVGATITHAGNGQLQLTNIGAGSFSFTYTLADRLGRTAMGTVHVTVQQPPISAIPDQISGPAEQTISGNLLQNDLGSGLMVTNFTNPTNGTLSLTPDGQFFFTTADCLPASFTYTVQDACQQTASADVTINPLDQMPPTLSCPADLTVSCGSPVEPPATGSPQISDFCDPQPTASFTDEISGTTCNLTITRTWTVVDKAGNAATCIQIITVQPVDCSFSAVPAITPAPCGTTAGAISLALFPPGEYTISWSNGQTGPLAADLAPETYTATVTDVLNACTEVQEFTVPEIPPEFIDSVMVIPATCPAPGDIIITLNNSGSEPYTVLLDGPVTIQVTEVPPGPLNLSNYADLVPGAYILTVQSGVVCIEVIPATVPYTPPYQLSALVVQNPSCPTCSDGAVTFQAEPSATLPLQILINGAPSGMAFNHTFPVNNLPVGTFEFQVIDQGGSGCASNPVTISFVFDPTPEKWKTTARPFLDIGPVLPVLPGSAAWPQAFQPYVPEHPNLSTAQSEFIFFEPRSVFGLAIPAGANREWRWEARQFGATLQTVYPGGPQLRTPLDGRSHQLGMRQFLPAGKGLKSFIELGGSWLRMEATQSWINSEQLPIATPVEQDIWNGFLHTGLQLRLNRFIQIEVESRMDGWLNQPANHNKLTGASPWGMHVRLLVMDD